MLNKMSSKSKSDKAQLERKLYLVRENPEPVCDISNCALINVPSGIYSLCKVFRKESLLLQFNKLSSLTGGGTLKDLSLIVILDLHCNEFSILPPSIIYLESLRELYLQQNKLKKLPDEITRLKNLCVLNISKNQLKKLPEEMGMLQNLTFLDLSYNKDIQNLPKSLGRAQKLSKLVLEGLNLSYPSKDITSGGTIVIIAFLANECGAEKCASENFGNTIKINKENFLEKIAGSSIEAAVKKLDKMKQEKLTNLLNVEENFIQQQKKELERQDLLKRQKEKWLKELASQQIQLEEEIEKVHIEKDKNRFRLLSSIYNAEKEADNVIRVFLKNGEQQRQVQAALIERETQEIMQMLSISYCKQSGNRTKETLVAMEKCLQEELFKEKRLAEYAEFKNLNAQSLLSLEINKNDHLQDIIQDQEKSRQDLISKLRQDELLQKAVVAAALERSDARSWSIVQQINLIQAQLASLTAIELERRKYQLDQQLNDIADKRVILSGILISLFDQQEERRRQLLETMKEFENRRDNSDLMRRDSLFWLHQYQSLIEFRPQGLLETLDSCLVRHIAICGVMHCLPFLSTLPSVIRDLDDEQLISIGISNADDRRAIKMAVENYLAEKKLLSQENILPSAPFEEACTSSTIESSEFVATAPIECVVCMDSYCNVLFLPCGHFCCCGKCAAMIPTECPMCRTFIEHKVSVS